MSTARASGVYSFRGTWKKLAFWVVLSILLGALVGVAAASLWDIDWEAVAAVSTAIAVIVYLGGLWLTSHQTWVQLQQDRDQFEKAWASKEEEREAREAQRDAAATNREAAATKAAINDFSIATRRVCRLIEDGSAVVSVGWLVAQSYVDLARRGARSDAILRDRLHELVMDESIFLSLWVDGLENSPSMSALNERAAELPALASRVRGELSVTWLLADIVTGILDDIRMVFLRTIEKREFRELIVTYTSAATTRWSS